MMDLNDNYYVSKLYLMRSERRRCRPIAQEWSDGKVEWGYPTSPCVQKSLLTGKYLPTEEFIKEMGAGYDQAILKDLSVIELADAFATMPECSVDSKLRIEILWNIVHTFNDKYRRIPNSPEPTLRELNCFINAAMAMQRYNNRVVPPSIKAELFRELRLFRHTVAVYASSPSSKDNMEENEIMDEVLLRALRGDSDLFVINHRRFIGLGEG